MTEQQSPTPKQVAEVLARIKAIRMDQTAAALQLGAATIRASIAIQAIAEMLQAGANAEFWDHPDVLETDLSFVSWYPEVSRG
jgi:hypothetical protein